MYVSDTVSGNPYHNEKGQFDTKYSSFNYKGKEISKWEDLLTPDQLNKYNSATDEQKEKIKQGMHKIYADLAKSLGAKLIEHEEFKPGDTKEEQQSPQNIKEEPKPKAPNIVNNKDVTPLTICNQYAYLDESKVSQLSDSEFLDLKKSIQILEAKQDIIDNDEELKHLSSKKFFGLWKDPVDGSFKNLNFDGKIDYFKTWYKGEDAEEKISQINELRELSEKYQSRLNEINQKFEIAQKVVDRCTNENYTYGVERKKKALWFKTYNEAVNYFKQTQKNYLDNLQKTDYKALETVKYYTGSFSSFNEPLRKIKYTGSNVMEQGFVNQIKALTRAIDGCKLEQDMWVQRGLNSLTISDNMEIGYGASETDLQKLVGQSFQHPSFYSAGAAKGTGFVGPSIILNTYCPKGTKALYVDSISEFKGENEIILQRGYTYRITKAERNKEQDKIYIDVEVILDSDENKYNDEELKEIESKYIDIY